MTEMTDAEFLRQGAVDCRKAYALYEDEQDLAYADRLESIAKRLETGVIVPRELLGQFKRDLASAHAEICKLQDLDPDTHDWPDWTPQANTLRWIDRILKEASNGS